MIRDQRCDLPAGRPDRATPPKSVARKIGRIHGEGNWQKKGPEDGAFFSARTLALKFSLSVFLLTARRRGFAILPTFDRPCFEYARNVLLSNDRSAPAWR